MKRAIAAAICGVLVSACARSLRTPDSIDTMAQASDSSGAALLLQADAAFAQRKDLSQAVKAEELFLQAARASPQDPRTYAGAIRAKAFRLGREKDPEARMKLAESAVSVGQLCEESVKGSAVCDYWLGAALGLQARERVSTAHDALPHIVELLQRAKKSDPKLDKAGPTRLLALVELRAPGWPLGPGDLEAGLADAQVSATLSPDFAPNQLALAEGLKKNGRAEEAKAAYSRALKLAEATTDDPDAIGWAEDARAASH